MKHVALAFALASAPTALANWINVDLDDGNGAPAPTYAAACSPGLWNQVGSTGPIALLDFAGNPTGVTLEIFGDPGNVGFVETTHQATTGDDALLLRDYGFSTSTGILLRFSGLVASPYAVTTYAVGRQDFPASSTVWLNDNLAGSETIEGLWEGGFAEGVTHVLQTTTVGDDGVLDVHVQSPGDAFVNGIQIDPLPAPGAVLPLLGLGWATRRRRRGAAA